MRRVLALSASCALAFAPVASAAPSAASESGSAAQFRLTTRGGAYMLSLLASTPVGGGAPHLRVRLAAASGAVTHFAGELPSSAVTVAGGVTTLRTHVGSAPLRVVFRPEAPVVTVGFGNVDSSDDADQGWLIAGNGGTADVTLGPVRCRITLMATGTATVVEGTRGPTGLDKGLGLPLRGARCSDLPISPFPPPLP